MPLLIESGIQQVLYCSFAVDLSSCVATTVIVAVALKTPFCALYDTEKIDAYEEATSPVACTVLQTHCSHTRA